MSKKKSKSKMAGEPGDNIFDAAFSGDIDKVAVLLKNEVKCNVQDKNGNTPIIYACMGDKVEVARLLIEAGANVHMKNLYGLNALAYTKGLFRRAQILRKWELCTPKGRANTTGIGVYRGV